MFPLNPTRPPASLSPLTLPEALQLVTGPSFEPISPPITDVPATLADELQLVNVPASHGLSLKSVMGLGAPFLPQYDRR